MIKVGYILLLSAFILSCTRKNKADINTTDRSDSIPFSRNSEVAVWNDTTPPPPPPIRHPDEKDPCPEGRKEVITGKTKYIIVSMDTYYELNSEQYTKNAALLINERNTVLENEKLFINNIIPYLMPCGYDFDISFWHSADSMIWMTPYNMECTSFCFDDEEIRTMMEKYGRQMYKNPSHYIYDLKISSKISTAEVLRTFERSGLLVFFLRKGLYGTEVSEYYDVQLLDTSDDLGVVKRKLKKYPIVLDVSEYEP